MGVQEPASGSEENPRNHISGSADATFSREQVHKVVQQSFETLGIPRLGPAPTKPSYFVEFDMGRLGRLTARYHWVGVHGQGLFLIYDRRYELGTEYVPPNLGKEVFTVNCPEQNKSFKVQNPGFVHPFGKLLIINLVIKDDVDQGQLEVDEVPPMQLGDGRSTEMDVQSAVTLDQMLNPH